MNDTYSIRFYHKSINLNLQYKRNVNLLSILVLLIFSVPVAQKIKKAYNNINILLVIPHVFICRNRYNNLISCIKKANNKNKGMNKIKYNHLASKCHWYCFLWYKLEKTVGLSTSPVTHKQARKH